MAIDRSIGIIQLSELLMVSMRNISPSKHKRRPTTGLLTRSMKRT